MVNSLAFQHLTDDMIRELVPRVGRRAIFRHKYLEYKRKEDKTVSFNIDLCVYALPCDTIFSVYLFSFSLYWRTWQCRLQCNQRRV